MNSVKMKMRFFVEINKFNDPRDIEEYININIRIILPWLFHYQAINKDAVGEKEQQKLKRWTEIYEREKMAYRDW